MKKNAGALAHSHPGIEQVCYMLDGRAMVEVGGQKREIGPGEACFFQPANGMCSPPPRMRSRCS